MKILLVDDHPLFREGLAALLGPMIPGASIEQAGDCEEAFALLNSVPDIDLVLMDIGLPGMSGTEGIATCKDRYPGTPVVALSSSDDRGTVLAALDAGAVGFIPKTSTPGVLAGALKVVMAKGIYLPPSAFLGRQERPMQAPRPSAPSAPGRRPSDLGLTPRQADVLYLILQGQPAKLICRELGLSSSTVKVHTSAVLRALNVTTRTQAVVAASRLGLSFDKVLA